MEGAIGAAEASGEAVGVAAADGVVVAEEGLAEVVGCPVAEVQADHGDDKKPVDAIH